MQPHRLPPGWGLALLLFCGAPSLLSPLGCASALPPDDSQSNPTGVAPTPTAGGDPATPPAATTPTASTPVIIGTAGMTGGGLFGQEPDTTDTDVSGPSEGGAAGQAAVTPGAAGNPGASGGTATPPAVSPDACDFTLVATQCAAQACERCNPQPMFDSGFTTTCDAIISCVESSDCSTQADPLCAMRDLAAGTPNLCTSQAEQGGIGNTSGTPTPFSCAMALYQCACALP